MKASKITLCCRLLVCLLLLINISAANAAEKMGGERKEETLSPKRLLILEEFKIQEQDLRARKELLSKKLQAHDQDIIDTRSSLASTQGMLFLLERVENILTIILFPLSGILFGHRIFLLIFFPVFLLNLALYLHIRENQFFKAWKIPIVFTFVLILLLFFAPSLVPAQEKSAVESKDPIEQKLERVSELLEMDQVQRTIKILEAKIFPVIELPEIDVKNPHLDITSWPRVDVEKPEYHYVLGSLYLQNGDIGKAIDELKKLISFRFRATRDEQKKYGNMLINAAKFLLDQNMREATADTIKTALAMIHDTSSLLDLASFLLAKNMDRSADETISSAIRSAAGYESLLQIASFLLKHGRREDANKALQIAIERQSDLEPIIQVLSFGLKNNLSAATGKAIEKANKVCKGTPECLHLVTFLLDSKRDEDAIQSLVLATEKVPRRRLVDDLLMIAEFSSQKGFYEQAIGAVEKLVVHLGEAGLEKAVPAPGVLYTKRQLPADASITLPVYLGALQQKAGLVDKAQKSFERAVTIELDRMIERYAYHAEGNLNNFFYLRELWEGQGKNAAVAKLAPIYVYLEGRYLDGLRRKNLQLLEGLKKEIGDLEASEFQKVETIKRLKAERGQVRWAVALHGLRVVAIVLVVLSVLAGCAIKSWHYARDTSVYKTFAFVFRFYECVGWVQCFTILSIPVGLINILVSQLLLLVQKIQQDGEHLRRPIETRGLSETQLSPL